MPGSEHDLHPSVFTAISHWSRDLDRRPLEGAISDREAVVPAVFPATILWIGSCRSAKKTSVHTAAAQQLLAERQHRSVSSTCSIHFRDRLARRIPEKSSTHQAIIVAQLVVDPNVVENLAEVPQGYPKTIRTAEATERPPPP